MSDTILQHPKCYLPTPLTESFAHRARGEVDGRLLAESAVRKVEAIYETLPVFVGAVAVLRLLMDRIVDVTADMDGQRRGAIGRSLQRIQSPVRHDDLFLEGSDQ